MSQVVVSADEIGRLNPQSGDMRHLDHIIWHSEDKVHWLGLKTVREDEFWIPGHIPGRPLMPGVLMIEAAAQLSSAAFRFRTGEKRFLALTRIRDAVFRTQVVPGDTLYLLMSETKFNPRRFAGITQGIINDTIAFEATISGMVVNDDQGRS